MAVESYHKLRKKLVGEYIEKYNKEIEKNITTIRVEGFLDGMDKAYESILKGELIK